MRHLLPAVFSLAFAALCHASEPPVPSASAAPHVHNIARAFADFWDAAKDKPAPEQLAEFKKQVAPGFPGFYSIARFDGERTQAQMDALIEAYIKNFPAIREAYLRKTQQFESELPRYIAGFKTWFPDYEPAGDIYVLHSLGEMDGGTRTIDGRNYLIFGIDGMVRYHGSGNETAFFDHELFHTYHYKAMSACDDERIWSSLWQEGLATYVSKVMNPTADDKELLLYFPDRMSERTKTVLPAAFDHLEKVLDNSDHATYASLFNTSSQDGTGLPPRRGYYLGFLVAQEAAKKHDVRELAKLSCDQARELVYSTVHALRASMHQ
jgi:hypothetical protein